MRVRGPAKLTKLEELLLSWLQTCTVKQSPEIQSMRRSRRIREALERKKKGAKK